MQNYFPILAANAPALKPIYDVVDYPKNVWPMVLTVILIALVIGPVIGFFLKRFLSQNKGRLDIPPETLALKAIDQLMASNMIAQGKVEAFFTALSRIIRVYIEARFDIDAPDMTTEEFLVGVQDNQKLDPTHKQNLKEFMEICDQIKFAKFNPDPESIEKLVSVARDFIGSVVRTEETSQG